MFLKIIYLFVLIKSVISNDQLINFVPDTSDFDLIASESINNQYSSVVDLTTDQYQQECVEAHNAKRKLHGVDELIYDPKLLNDAKEAAFQSALNNKLTRLEDCPYGENLVASSKRLLCTNAVNLMYQQNTFYNYHVPMYSKQTGSFTQLVWRDTKRFACAQAKLKNGSRYFTVCLYDPFGNISDQFRSNVLPPIAKRLINNEFVNITKEITKNQPIQTASSTTSGASLISTNESNELNTTAKTITFSTSSIDYNKPLTSFNTGVHETNSNILPQILAINEPRPSSLVKPILNKSYYLSPGMLMRLKNLNKPKPELNGQNLPKATVDKLVASASELDLFIESNTIPPSPDTDEISSLIERKNDTSNDTSKTSNDTINNTVNNASNNLKETVTPILNDDLLTTMKPF